MDELELKAAEPTGIPAEEIDLGFAAQLNPFVGTAFLDDEAILLDPATGASHLLDAPGTVIVQCLDGVSTLGEIAADIAEVLGLERARIEEDVLTLVRTLGENGLVDGVLRDQHAGHDHDQGLPGGLPVGSDLAGWGGWDGVPDGQTLLVNWGTRCGYCSRISGDLAELEPRLASAGVGLLLVTTGTPEELREQLGEVALPVLHVEEEPEFFQGLGTPVAYVVDTERQTSLPLAVGAKQVPELAGQVAENA